MWKKDYYLSGCLGSLPVDYSTNSMGKLYIKHSWARIVNVNRKFWDIVEYRPMKTMHIIFCDLRVKVSSKCGA